MKKYFVVLISLLLLLLLPVFGADSQSEDDIDGEGIGTLHMSSNVPKNAGVNVPAGATLVGNLLIEYSYDGNEWEYVSDADVEIDNLGQVSDSIYLQASYYGNAAMSLLNTTVMCHSPQEDGTEEMEEVF